MRLSERLDEGLERKLTLLSAPAGFGKTTLLSSWIRELSGDARPVSWLSVDSGDNDPARFWRYFVTATDQLQPGSGTTALTLLGYPYRRKELPAGRWRRMVTLLGVSTVPFFSAFHGAGRRTDGSKRSRPR